MKANKKLLAILSVVLISLSCFGDGDDKSKSNGDDYEFLPKMMIKGSISKGKAIEGAEFIITDVKGKQLYKGVTAGRGRYSALVQATENSFPLTVTSTLADGSTVTALQLAQKQDSSAKKVSYIPERPSALQVKGNLDLQSGMISYYPFTDGSLDDDKGSNNLKGSVSSMRNRDGKADMAASFNGSEKLITSKSVNLGGNAARTLSFWLKPTVSEEHQFILNWGSASENKAFGAFIGGNASSTQNTKTVKFYGHDGGDLETGGDVSTSVWQQWIFTYSGSTLTVYKDGELVKRASKYLNTTKSILTLGARGDLGTNELSSNYNFTGGLDDIRIYNRALTKEEVAGLYSAESEPLSFIQHVNPLTDFLAKELLKDGIDISKLDPLAIRQQAQEIVSSVLGDGVNIDDFSSSESFAPPVPGDYNTKPSPLAVMLDTLVKITPSGTEGGLSGMLSEMKEEREANPDAPVVTEKTDFQITIASNMIALGYSATEVKAELTELIEDESSLDVIEDMSVIMEEVVAKAKDMGLQDPAAVDIILQGASSAAVSVVQKEEAAGGSGVLDPSSLAVLVNDTTDSVSDTLITIVKVNTEAGSSLSSIGDTVDNLTSPPENITYSDTELIYVTGQTITPDIPTADGIDITYSISGSLPAGLSFDTQTGTISGTPTGGSGSYELTITGENLLGTSTVTVSIIIDGPPVPADSGTLSFSGLEPYEMNLLWSSAADDITPTSSLKYRAYYCLSTSSLDTVSDIENNGIPLGFFTSGINSSIVVNLQENTDYNFNVLVIDTSGNKASYTATTQTTPIDVAPVPGNSGTIASSGIAAHYLSVNWTKAADDVSEEEALEYIVFYSTSNNIDTTANMIANGTTVGTYSANINTKNITGLTENTTYYFNVMVKDEKGKTDAYTSFTEDTLVETEPTPGNGGAIAASNINYTSLVLSWNTASDIETANADLAYLVYYSTASDINTVSNAEANGTAIGAYNVDIATVNVSNLTRNTDYYFTVVVKDGYNNKSVYNTLNQPVLTDNPPSVGNGGAIAANNISYSSVDLSWTNATDDTSTQGNLEYLVYRSLSDNITSVNDMETNGMSVGSWTTDINSLSIQGLSNGTTYYFNIMVQDEYDLKSAYTSIAQATNAPPEAIVPTVGGAGTLSTSSVAQNTVDINWTKASDNASAAADLLYLAYYSTSDDLGSVANIEANGTGIGDYELDIATVTATGLVHNTLYYFNVLVIDEVGNKSVYTTTNATTLLDTAAVPGSTGTLTVSNLGAYDLTLNWTKATDDVDAESALEYQAYYSASNNIADVAAAEANGTALGSIANDIASKAVSGLTPQTSYYFNVIVSDSIGNKASYTMLIQDTPADSPPQPGNSGIVSAVSITPYALTLNWTKASDNTSAVSDIQYLVYFSTSADIATVLSAESNGTPIDLYAADINTKAISGLLENTSYYFTVLTKDELGNKAAYTMQNETTIDDAAPSVSDGIITTSAIAAYSMTLSWVKATDDIAAQDTLQYRAYYSLNNDLDSVADIEANGTPVGSYSTDIDTIIVSGLDYSTTYYFNILVMDDASQKSIYTSKSAATLEDTVPTPGAGGAITFSTIDENNITINWTKSTDTESVQANLEYLVYRSLFNNITTVADMVANGFALNGGLFQSDISTETDTGLIVGTDYYYNVIVKDEVGNEVANTMSSIATLDRFMTTWKTDNTGTSNDNQITIPTDGSSTYNYTIDWGDGNTETITSNTPPTHSYSSSGTYTVKIDGTFPHIHFNGAGDEEKILTIKKWGNIVWASMAEAYSGCANLNIEAGAGSPDLSNVTSMREMFYQASVLNSDLSGWNVSNVTDMYMMFSSADNFNGDISGWDVSNVTSMLAMFSNTTAFNGDISGWDVSNVTTMYMTFHYAAAFNGDISGWNVSSVTDMNYMFNHASSFANHNLSSWVVSGVTTHSNFFVSVGAGNTEPTWP